MPHTQLSLIKPRDIVNTAPHQFFNESTMRITMPLQPALVSRAALVALAFCFSLPPTVAANDLNKRQIAAAASPTDAQRRDAQVARLRDYETRRERLEQQIRDANASTAILFGAFAGLAVSKSPLGAIGGAATGALGKIAIEDWLNRRLLDRSTRLTLMDTRVEQPSLYDDFVASAPGTEVRSLLTLEVMSGSPYMGLLRDLDIADRRQGPLLDHASTLWDHLLVLEPDAYQDVRTMSERDAAATVEREFPDVRDAVVAYGATLNDGHSQFLELAADVNDIVRRIQDHGETALAGDPDPGLPALGTVVYQRGDDFVVPDRIYTQNGDILDLSGQKVGEHDDSLGEIDGELVDLDASYRRLGSAEDFEQSLIYEALPSAAKLRALENPSFMAHLSPQKREEIRERLQLLSDIRDTREKAQNLASVTSSMANILTRTGVLDPEDARRANDAAGLVASTAMAVGSCYLGEPVSCMAGVSGMVTGLSNLFGGGSGNAFQDAVLGGIAELREGQQKLLEGQLAIRQDVREVHEDVLRNRLAFLERVDELDEAMVAGFDDVQRSIGAVMWEIGQLGRTAIDFSEFGTRLRECEDFARRRAEYDFDEHVAYVPGTLGFALGEFSTWAELESHYAANATYWQPCLRAMRDLFSRRQIRRDVHNVFLMSIYRGRDSGGTLLTDYVNPGFAPLVRLMSRHYAMGTDEAGLRTFCALLNSPLSHVGIDMRGATLFEAESCGDPGAPSPFDTLWSRDRESTILAPSEWLLHVDALLELSHLMMELLPYYQITDEENEELLSVGAVAYAGVSKPREVEIEIVETAYRLVSIAIAQQVLLTGDIFLPLVHGYVFSENVDPRSRSHAIDVLDRNPTIARNWLVMEVRRQLGLGGNLPTTFDENMELYRRIYESRSTATGGAASGLVYERLFATYWEFSATTNEVVLRKTESESITGAEVLRVAMPTPEEVAAGSYRGSRGYVEAVRLRQAIMEYALRNDLDLFGGGEFVRSGHFLWR